MYICTEIFWQLRELLLSTELGLASNFAAVLEATSSDVN
jgi:hypothetical protein